MKCSVVQRRFTALFDGDIPESERQDVEIHLLICPACQNALQEHQHFLKTCDEFLVCPGPPLPFDLIRQRLPEIEPLEEVLAFVPKLRIHSAYGRLAMAAMMVLFVAGMPWSWRNARQACNSLTAAVEQNRFQIEEAYEGRFPMDDRNRMS